MPAPDYLTLQKSNTFPNKQDKSLLILSSLQYNHMRKRILLSILAICSFNLLLAQNKTTDSLRNLLTITKEDTNRVLLMANIARTYIYSKPDSSMFFAHQ